MAYDVEKLSTGEKIVYTAHMHMIVLIKAAIQWIVLFVLCMIILLGSNTFLSATLGGAQPILTVIALGVAVLALVMFGVSYLVWQSEEYTITNERVIKTEGILNKRESATSLDKINDIQTSQSVFGRMLGYGEVELLTGSDTGVNKLHYLSDPFEFKKIMLNAKNRQYGDASDIASGAAGRRANEEMQQQPQQPIYVVPPMPYNDPRGQFGNGGGMPPATAQQPSAQQIADSISQLARLRDSGILSEAEFQAKKNELMNRL